MKGRIRLSFWGLAAALFFLFIRQSSFTYAQSVESESLPSIRIGLWFTAEQIQQLEKDSSLYHLLPQSGAELVVWEGNPDSFTRKLMETGSFNWLPMYPSKPFFSIENETDQWARDVEQFNLAWINEILSLDAENEVLIKNSKQGLLIGAYPFFQLGATQVQLNSVFQDYREWSVLIRPEQFKFLSETVPAIVTCLAPISTICPGNRIHTSNFTSNQKLLSQIEEYSDLLIDRGGGELFINGIQWLEVLSSHPDFQLVISDLKKGRSTVFPKLRKEKAGVDSWTESLLHLFLLVILISYFLVFRSGGYYLQRLYRYFLSFGYAEIEISSRRERSIAEALIYLVLGASLIGLLLNSFLLNSFSTIGIDSLTEFIPYFSVEWLDSPSTLLFSFLFSLILLLISSIWIWVAFSKHIHFPLVIKSITWPLHLMILPVLLENVLIESASNTYVVQLISGACLLFFLSILILGNLNLYQVPRRKKTIWLLTGTLGYIAFLGFILALFLFSTDLAVWLRFASSL